MDFFLDLVFVWRLHGSGLDESWVNRRRDLKNDLRV